MHEGDFTQQIVEAILEELKKFPESHPRAVHVQVGQIFHLQPESVHTHFRIFTKGTPLADAVLELEDVEVTILCQNCGQRSGVDDHHLLICEGCGSTAVEIVEGNAVIVQSIELEESESPAG
jgi:hydrogenase nickel incorporation protein HypA/HybF